MTLQKQRVDYWLLRAWWGEVGRCQLRGTGLLLDEKVLKWTMVMDAQLHYLLKATELYIVNG